MPHHPEGHSMTKKLEKLPKKKIKKASKKLEKLPKQKIKKAAKQLGKQMIQEPLREMGKQILAEKLTKNPIDMKYSKGPHMGHSPAEMGHSPAEMGHSPAEMASWLSKHAAQSRIGSPLKGHCMGD